MRIELELWHLILLLLGFFTFACGFGKLMLDQVEKRLAERFDAQDSARQVGQQSIREVFAEHLTEERRNALALQGLERDFLKWQAELPIHYVRREDYVRGQSVIEAKLDALFAKIELVHIKGASNV